MGPQALQRLGVPAEAAHELRLVQAKLTTREQRLVDAYVAANFRMTGEDPAWKAAGERSATTARSVLSRPHVRAAVRVFVEEMSSKPSCIIRALQETGDEDAKIRLMANRQVGEFAGHINGDKRLIVEDGPNRAMLEQARLILMAANNGVGVTGGSPNNAQQGEVVDVGGDE